MRGRCKECVHYKRDPQRKQAVLALQEAGGTARGPMLRAKYGGWCLRRENEIHPFMKVPMGRDLVDSNDTCGSFKPKG